MIPLLSLEPLDFGLILKFFEFSDDIIIIIIIIRSSSNFSVFRAISLKAAEVVSTSLRVPQLTAKLGNFVIDVDHSNTEPDQRTM